MKDKIDDWFIRFLGIHSPKIVFVIMIFQVIMFFRYLWFHKVWEFGFIGLCITIESLLWYWIVKEK